MRKIPSQLPRRTSQAIRRFVIAACTLMPASAFAGTPHPVAAVSKCAHACKTWVLPANAQFRDQSDAAAALESIQFALSRVGDGSTYVWRRRGGKVSGVIQPTASFRNDRGAICRHLVMILTMADNTKKAEGVACRLKDGRWSLEG